MRNEFNVATATASVAAALKFINFRFIKHEWKSIKKKKKKEERKNSFCYEFSEMQTV